MVSLVWQYPDREVHEREALPMVHVKVMLEGLEEGDTQLQLLSCAASHDIRWL